MCAAARGTCMCVFWHRVYVCVCMFVCVYVYTFEYAG